MLCEILLCESEYIHNWANSFLTNNSNLSLIEKLDWEMLWPKQYILMSICLNSDMKLGDKKFCCEVGSKGDQNLINLGESIQTTRSQRCKNQSQTRKAKIYIRTVSQWLGFVTLDCSSEPGLGEWCVNIYSLDKQK